MKYTIFAEYLDNNGVWVASNGAETLGDAHMAEYESKEEAEEMLADLNATNDQPERVRYEIIEA